MARHKKGHGRRKLNELENRLEVMIMGTDEIMIAWRRNDGTYEHIVVPEKAATLLVKRLASWMEL